MNTAAVWAVVPTYSSAGRTGQCLDSLSANSHAPNVVVAHNAAQAATSGIHRRLCVPGGHHAGSGHNRGLGQA